MELHERDWCRLGLLQSLYLTTGLRLGHCLGQCQVLRLRPCPCHGQGQRLLLGLRRRPGKGKLQSLRLEPAHRMGGAVSRP